MARKVRKDKQGRVLKQGESQRADGHYVYRYTDNGQRKIIYGNNLIELRKKEKELKLNNLNGIEYSSISLNNLFRDFMQNVKTKNVKEQTSEIYKKAWANHIYNSIGKKKVKDIKKAEIINFYSQLQNEKGLTKQTIKTTHSILKMTFDYALNSELILNNPCTNALNYLKGENTKEKRTIPDNEQIIIAEYLKEYPKYNYNVISNLFIVGCNTGLRIGELLALTWKDIDFKNNIINVNKTLVTKPKLAIGKTKTESANRQVPMLRNVRNALHEQQLLQFRNGSSSYNLDGFSGFVFANEKGKLFRSSDINSIFNYSRNMINKREMVAAEKEQRDPQLIDHFTNHCMRHTFATKMVQNGLDYKSIQTVMGHADITTTLNIYTHSDLEKNKEEIRKLEPEQMAL